MFAYDAADALHDHFIACFGSPVCMRIHEGMFRGEHYILRTKARRNEFEDAGAHTIVCTTVVALAASWVAGSSWIWACTLKEDKAINRPLTPVNGLRFS